MELTVAIARRINELMLQNNLTQYGLSVKSGINQSVISRILNHKKMTLTIHTIYAFTMGLNISLPEFFNSPLFFTENLAD